MLRNIIGQAILQVALFVSFLVIYRYKTHGITDENKSIFADHNYSFVRRDKFL